MLQFAGANKVKQRKIITDTRLLAEKHSSHTDYVSAIECYAELITMLDAFKSKAPHELGNAYRDFAAVNLARAEQLNTIAPKTAELHRAQANLQIQQAMLSYPSTATKELDDCQAKLIALTVFLGKVTDEEAFVDVEALSVEVDASSSIDVEALSNVEEILEQKPAMLHWKKALMQRYNAKQDAANNTLPTQTSTARVTNKL